MILVIEAGWNMTKEQLSVQNPNLSINFLGQHFNNPIILGSGSLADSIEKTDGFINSQVGAVIPRTTRLQYAPGRDRHPSPHLDINSRNGTMRNSEWTGATIDYWRPHLDKLSQSERVAMSVSGRNIDECLIVCQELDQYNFPFLELNISCAHSNEINGFITRNSEHISRLIRTLKDGGIKTPLAVKLGHSDFIVPLAMVAEESGADAIIAINSIGPIIDFDISSGKPQFTLGIAGGKGGLSGKSIYGIALTDVLDLAGHLKIPIIGCGGVSTAEDAIKMIMAGASAVEVYTAAHLMGNKAPQFLDNLIKNIAKWMSVNGYDNLSQIQNIALSNIPQAHQMTPLIPNVNLELCKGCGKCDAICLEGGAITMKKTTVGSSPDINPDHCIGCGACVTVCPTQALQY